MTAALARPRIRRDCAHPRARHAHGTIGAYNSDRCRCERCTRHHMRYVKAWRYRRLQAERAGQLCGLIDATGTRRRLQALSAVGWSTTALGRMLGVSQQRASELRVTPACVNRDIAQRVANVYNQLWDRSPIGPAAERTRLHAARAGWVVPLAWDDDTINEPDADPLHRLPGRATPARTEQIEETEYLLRFHLTAAQIAERLRVDVRSVERYKAELRAA